MAMEINVKQRFRETEFTRDRRRFKPDRSVAPRPVDFEVQPGFREDTPPRRIGSRLQHIDFRTCSNVTVKLKTLPMLRISLLILALLTLMVLMFNSASQPAAPKLAPVPELRGQVPDDEEFRKNVLESTVPVLVDFNATWCGPCQALKPELKKLTENLQGRLKIYEVDVDEKMQLSHYYRATSIPLVILFVNGTPVGGSMGLANAEELQAMIEPHLPK